MNERHTTQEAKIGGLQSKARLGKYLRPYLTNNYRKKRAGGRTQEVKQFSNKDRH
jgi:hypothetical protein